MAHFETGNRRALDVQINIVPFIDLMSTLTVFLLFAAVWNPSGQLDVASHVDGPDDPNVIICYDDIVSLLVDGDGVTIGHSRINESVTIPRTSRGYDWAAVGSTLRTVRHGGEPYENLRIAVESTAQHPVAYQELVTASDVAHAAGITNVTIWDPSQLPAPFH